MTITPTKIVQHLKQYLPLFTSVFTEQLTISAASMGAFNILTITSADHGKVPGQYIVMTEGTSRNPLSDAVLNDGTVIFTTGFEHDQTRPKLPGDKQTLILDGFGNAWDDEHEIIDIPNRWQFVINLPPGETLAPVLGGGEYLVDNIPLGAHPIDTVIDDDNFTVDLSYAPDQPTGTIDNLSTIGGFRIAAAADFERAKAAYSKHATGKPYLFVIMTDADVNKDRHTLNDGVAGFTRQDEWLLKILQNFSTTVFIPTTEDISGSNAQDLAYGAITRALISALFGAVLDDDSIIKYVAVPSGHGPGEYNSAYYAHVWDWQAPTAIHYEDGFLIQATAAFRDIQQTLDILNDDQAQMSSQIDLDDEPMPGT